MGVDGSPQGRIGPALTQYTPRVSPDGTRVAVDIEDMASSNIDIWIWDLNRSIRTRLTFDANTDRTPVWSPDGRELAFYSAREAGRGLYVKSADGTGEARLVAASAERLFPMSWSPDGRLISYVEAVGADADIWVAHADISEPPRPFLKTPFAEWDGMFSPDGRWLALTSEESGREEVYVTPFPGPGSKWQVSTNEGDRPRWSPDGKHLYYLDNDDHLNIAEIDGSGPAFSVGRVRQLHELNPSRPGAIYDLFPDGERLVINHRLGMSQLTRLVLVQNWTEELR